jgi:hypothetical protein
MDHAKTSLYSLSNDSTVAIVERSRLALNFTSYSLVAILKFKSRIWTSS